MLCLRMRLALSSSTESKPVLFSAQRQKRPHTLGRVAFDVVKTAINLAVSDPFQHYLGGCFSLARSALIQTERKTRRQAHAPTLMENSIQKPCPRRRVMFIYSP
jgi:hypothetical protein